MVYIDDVLIFTKTMEEHKEVVKRVLDLMQRHKLYLKPEKCKFHMTKVEFLGLVVSENCVEMDPIKVEGVSKWPVPKKKKDVQSFLEFTNFYRRFIKDYAKIARPLHNLTGKKEWEWGREQEEAFRDIKRKICSAPILTMPKDDGKFRIECDASDFAIGSILSQQQLDRKWKPIAFLSHALNPTERNYEIYDREMLAIIEALKDWRSFLEGLPEPFEIITDHSNLMFWQTTQDLSRRQARWALYLSRFNFTLVHKPSKLNTQADALSRMPDHHVSDANDNH